MDNLVSIIIPVYNTEKYLSRCIDSVVSQTYKNIEIILVDDGSTDNCPKICDSFALKDERIKAIHKKNCGAADSRNKGLDACSGDWILFLDSDDYYKSNDVIELLLQTAEKNNSDVVCFNYQRYYDGTGEYSKLLCPSIDKPCTKDNLIKSNIYTSSSCLKLIRSAVLSGIRFETDYIAEDILFCAQILKATDKITYCDKAVYVYRDRLGSKTNTIDAKYVEDQCKIIDILLKEGKGDNAFMAYIAFQYCTVLINMNFEKTDRNTENKIYGLKWVLKYDDILQVKIIHSVSKIIGIKLTSKLLFAFFKMSKKTER